MTKLTLLLTALALATTACSSDNTAVSSEQQARRAYLGLDKSIGKAITLGFEGFNSATSGAKPAPISHAELATIAAPV